MQLLHSKIIGEGKPLLILHGFLGMSDNWKTLGKLFSENGFQAHLIDQRNHGRSFHSETFSYKLLTADLKHYIEHYKLENCIVLGHSMGGKTAMEFATTYPNLINKLIIADISPKYYPAHHQQILAGLAALDFNSISSRTAADEKLSEFVSDFGTRQFLLKNLYWIEKGKLALRFNLKDLITNIEEIGKALPLNLIYNGETLFLKGEKSDYILEDDTKLINVHFPNSKIGTVANAGHWLHAENPKQFYSEVNSFINPQ